jgi:hypothetical protein
MIMPGEEFLGPGRDLGKRGAEPNNLHDKEAESCVEVKR